MYLKIFLSSVIDDIDIAQYMSPMLTTVHIPTDELGKMAFKMLFDRVNGRPPDAA